jgi:flagellar basal body rod protein FlgG
MGVSTTRDITLLTGSMIDFAIATAGYFAIVVATGRLGQRTRFPSTGVIRGRCVG